MRFRTLAVLGVVTGLGCNLTSLEEVALSGNLTAEPTSATVGQEVTVTIEANGTRLLSFLIDYDDGTEPDFLSVAGSRQARGSRVHTFEAPGTYEIVGRIDEFSDTLTRVVTVNVVEAGAATRIITVPSILRPQE